MLRASFWKDAPEIEEGRMRTEDIATEAPRAAIPPGTEVTVEYQPRFSLQRHQRALLKFLAEDIEGDWVSLAREAARRR